MVSPLLQPLLVVYYVPFFNAAVGSAIGDTTHEFDT